ncbi:MAG: aminotransferase class III-fold pyridoxal phosphate-dependent enzyme [Planctomycetaceae bacterium]|nr:aminotransferase class III-fold pyridoxal phosphate-dependent enzyme [Planctomycetaceae bacterium]
MTSSTIEARFRERFPQSGRLYERACRIFPSGVTHDGRYLEPYPVFVDRALGAIKHTVEGHPLVDYWVGHGALLLGHSHPAAVAAVQKQMALGTHYAAGHELELQWGEWVQKLVPSAERVRFTSSGTEATLMALRVARLVTGRSKVLKFIGHFHGWHDFLVPAAYSPYNPADLSTPGVPGAVIDDLVGVEPNDLAALEAALKKHQPACIIVEPTGGHWGTVPMRGEFLKAVRELATQHKTLLIFDEVITGFRVHPGGAQAAYGVMPDMTTLAKIVAGGLPGGALAGKADLMDAIAFNNRYGQKMRHPGTYNANPLSAAAGCAALEIVATGEPCETANQRADELRRRLNALFADKRADWIAYGDFSMIHILANYPGPRPDRADFVPCDNDYRRLDAKSDPKFQYAYRCALLLGGVDWFSWGGMTSSAHSAADLDATVAAFDRAIDLLRTDGWMK